MSPKADYSEDALIERPAIELFRSIGWRTANCFYETYGPNGGLGRGTSTEVDVEDLDRNMGCQSA